MHRKIDISISPAIAIGHLERRSICSCGYSLLREEAPIGKEYNVDLKSVRWAKFQCGGCGNVLEIRICDTWDAFGVNWFVLDVLDLDRAIPFAPRPDSWIPVKDNKVLPRTAFPGGSTLLA